VDFGAGGCSASACASGCILGCCGSADDAMAGKSGVVVVQKNSGFTLEVVFTFKPCRRNPNEDNVCRLSSDRGPIDIINTVRVIIIEMFSNAGGYWPSIYRNHGKE